LPTGRVLLFALASLPVCVLLSLLAALQFQLSLLLRTLLLGALLFLILTDPLAILLPSILLALSLLFLILIDALAVLFPALSLLVLILLDTLTVLLPSLLLLRTLI